MIFPLKLEAIPAGCRIKVRANRSRLRGQGSASRIRANNCLAQILVTFPNRGYMPCIFGWRSGSSAGHCAEDAPNSGQTCQQHQTQDSELLVGDEVRESPTSRRVASAEVGYATHSGRCRTHRWHLGIRNSDIYTTLALTASALS